MLVVTHEMPFAREVGTRVLFMDQDRTVVDAPSKMFFSDPRNERASAFLRRVHALSDA